jgi:hypothetical protein
MEEFQLPGFVAGKTLHCGNMAADLILQVRDTRQWHPCFRLRASMLDARRAHHSTSLYIFPLPTPPPCCVSTHTHAHTQVTESCARLVSCQTLEAVSDWAVPQGSRITVASSNETQVRAMFGHFLIQGWSSHHPWRLRSLYVVCVRGCVPGWSGVYVCVVVCVCVAQVVLALTGGELVHLALNTTQRALVSRPLIHHKPFDPPCRDSGSQTNHASRFLMTNVVIAHRSNARGRSWTRRSRASASTPSSHTQVRQRKGVFVRAWPLGFVWWM